MLLLVPHQPSARTGAKKTDGMTLLFAEMDRDHVTIREIPKMGRNAVDTNELFIDDLFVADEDVVGEVGKGFQAILAGLNAERVIAANAALGIGGAALRRAPQYAKERVVFGRPIGQNQGIAFPLAEAMIRLDAADAVVQQGDLAGRQRLPCGARGQLRPSSSPPRRRSTPPTSRCRSTAGSATARSSTSSATSARPGSSGSRRSARRWCSTTSPSTSSACPAATEELT